MLSQEIRHSTFRVAAPAIFLVATIFAIENSYEGLASWSNVTLVVFSAQSFVAPVIAGVAAWSGLRSRRRHMMEHEATAVLSVARIRSTHVLADIIWVSAGSVGMLAVLILRGAYIGMTGMPVAISLCVATALPLLFVLVGHGISLCVTRWIALPLSVAIPLVLYGINNFATGSGAALALNPLYRFTDDDPYLPSHSFYIGQSLLLLSYMVLGVCVIALLGRAKSIVLVVAMCVGAISVGASGIAAVHAHSANAVRKEVPQTIQLHHEASGLKLEVLDLYHPVGEELSETWGRIAVLTQESNLRFDRLVQDVEPTYDPIRPAGYFYRLDLNPNSPNIAASSVEMAFNDIARCDATPDKRNWWVPGQTTVRTWLQGLPEFPPSVFVGDSPMPEKLAFLYSLSEAEAQQWVRDHAENIRSCNWGIEDFH